MKVEITMQEVTNSSALLNSNFWICHQIVDKDGKPFYEVQLNEKTTLFSPKDVVKIIFEKLLGRSQLWTINSVNVPSLTYYHTDSDIVAVVSSAYMKARVPVKYSKV